MPNQVHNSQTTHFISVPRQSPGRSNRWRRQRGAVAISDDDEVAHTDTLSQLVS